MGYPLERGTWKITMDSGVRRWDTYIYFSNTHAPQNSGDYSYIPDINNEGNIIEPGNAECLITVGAYSSKWEWRDADSLYQSDTSLLDPSMNVEDTCFFSSRGPTRDGRNKPDILAPGAMIASSVSDHYINGPVGYTKYDSTHLAYDSCHYHRSGTSFAAPHIAGLVALMFQFDSELTCIDIIDCLQSTASGIGHVNAVEALRCVGADSFCQGRCGDANGDGPVNVSDAVWVINYVFIGGP